MKTRQFQQLAGMSPVTRLPLVVEGLEAIGANVQRIAREIEVCAEANAHGAVRLLRNLGNEEAGKYLILLDLYRSPHSDAGTISRQLRRAGNHLAKLIYAKVAGYSIATQSELLDAVDNLRQALYLDGPNDFDWIFPNELIAQREAALYVDLMESEGRLFWSSPPDDGWPVGVSQPMQLVLALMRTGIGSAAGLAFLEDAWRDFNATADTHYSEWARRSTTALENLSATIPVEVDWPTLAGRAVQLWPMPMVEVDISEVRITPEEMKERRESLFRGFLAREYGYPTEY